MEVRFPSSSTGIKVNYKTPGKKCSSVIGIRREIKVEIKDQHGSCQEILSEERELAKKNDAMSCEEVQNLLLSSKGIISCVLEDMIEHQREMEKLETCNKAMKEEIEVMKRKFGSSEKDNLWQEINELKKTLEEKDQEIHRLQQQVGNLQDSEDVTTLKELNKQMKVELEAACTGLKQVANLKKMLETERGARCGAESILPEEEQSRSKSRRELSSLEYKKSVEESMDSNWCRALQNESKDLKLQIEALQKLTEELKKENELLRELQRPCPDFSKELDEKCALENLLSLLQAELDAFKGQKLNDECEALRNELKRVMEQNCQLKALVDCYRQRLDLEKQANQLVDFEKVTRSKENIPKDESESEKLQIQQDNENLEKSLKIFEQRGVSKAEEGIKREKETSREEKETATEERRAVTEERGAATEERGPATKEKGPATKEKGAEEEIKKDEKETPREKIGVAEGEELAGRREDRIAREEKEIAREEKGTPRVEKEALMEEKETSKEEKEISGEEKGSPREDKGTTKKKAEAAREEGGATKGEERPVTVAVGALKGAVEAVKGEAGAATGAVGAGRDEVEATKGKEGAVTEAAGALKGIVEAAKGVEAIAKEEEKAIKEEVGAAKGEGAAATGAERAAKEEREITKRASGAPKEEGGAVKEIEVAAKGAVGSARKEVGVAKEEEGATEKGKVKTAEEEEEAAKRAVIAAKGEVVAFSSPPKLPDSKVEKSEADCLKELEQLRKENNDLIKKLEEATPPSELLKELEQVKRDKNALEQKIATGGEPKSETLQTNVAELQERIRQLEAQNAEKLKKVMEQHQKELGNLEKAYNENLNAMKSGYETDIRKLAERHKQSIMRLQGLHEDEVQELNLNYETQLDMMQTQSEAAIKDVAKGSATKMRILNDQHAKDKKDLENKFQEALEEKETQYLKEIGVLRNSLTKSMQELEAFKKRDGVRDPNQLKAQHAREVQKIRRTSLQKMEIIKEKFEEEKKKSETELELLKKKLKDQESGDGVCMCNLSKKKPPKLKDPSCPLDFNEVLEKILEQGLDSLTFNEIALVHRKACCALEGIVMKSNTSPMLELEPPVGDGCPHTPLLEADKQQLLSRIFTLESEIHQKQKLTQEAIISMEVAIKKERCRLLEVRNLLENEQLKNSELKLLLSSQTKLHADLIKEKDHLENQASRHQVLCEEKRKQLDDEMKNKKCLEAEIEMLKTKLKYLCSAFDAEKGKPDSKQEDQIEQMRIKLEQTVHQERRLALQLENEVKYRMQLQCQLQTLRQSFKHMVNLPAVENDINFVKNPLEIKSAKEKQNLDQIKEKKNKTKLKPAKKNKK